MYSTCMSLFASLAVVAPAAFAQTLTSSPGMQITPAPTAGGSAAPADQSAAFSSAIESYGSSLLDSPEISQVGINLVLAGAGSVIGQITATPSTLIPFPTEDFDLSSFATDPPTVFSALPWESEIPTGIKSSIDSIRTSAVLQAATIAQSVIGVSASLEMPSSSSTGAAPRVTGLPVGFGIVGAAVGAGAILL